MSSEINLTFDFIFKIISRNKKFVLVFLIFLILYSYFGYQFYYPPIDKSKTFDLFFEENIFIYIGIPTLYLLSIELYSAFKNTKNLSDIDTSREINQNPNTHNKVEQSKEERLTDLDSLDSFKLYFLKIVNTLEEKSIDSDKKASILLDNGKLYFITGITYFIIAIIFWQIYISYIGDFKTNHIYGIISTSLVFIFIQFISAWYLRQYKSFSDTSTYLTKIKSIFDKYMLIYLVSSEKGDKDFTILMEQLSSEIKWPETYLLKSADISFAKDALETMTTMAQTFKNEVKNKEAP
ncbi:hypothetical protein B9T38_14030 [Acinetobacter sp. ANC 4218]|uniref:hypothetical protein n=1 Tax=Acinetobacter sp. ANC 4218 TaxID=1977880 RepID=UPI000A33B9D0|nr:hypothetical protein [Acinetobacter sp. ANC 4218]OTG69897.1 hypothetical protein B9T38_14030 [Acinetobacter sp. ANC 4218]